jgi:hypothetical protein
MRPADVAGPLSQFHHTTHDREDILKLVRTMNAHAGDEKIADSVLKKTYELMWPELDIVLKAAAEASLDLAPEVATRELRDMVEELLELARAQERAQERAAAAATWAKMMEWLLESHAADAGLGTTSRLNAALLGTDDRDRLSKEVLRRAALDWEAQRLGLGPRPGPADTTDEAPPQQNTSPDAP